MVSFPNLPYLAIMASLRTRLDRNGRIVLPAQARRSLGVKAGDILIVEVEKDGVRLHTFGQSVREAQAVYRKALGKRKAPDLVAELKRLRRREFWPE